MGFPRQEHWSGLPFPSPGDLPNPGIKLESPALQVDSLPSEPPGKPWGGGGGFAKRCSRSFGKTCPRVAPTGPASHRAHPTGRAPKPLLRKPSSHTRVLVALVTLFRMLKPLCLTILSQDPKDASLQNVHSPACEFMPWVGCWSHLAPVLQFPSPDSRLPPPSPLRGAKDEMDRPTALGLPPALGQATVSAAGVSHDPGHSPPLPLQPRYK